MCVGVKEGDRFGHHAGKKERKRGKKFSQPLKKKRKKKKKIENRQRYGNSGQTQEMPFFPSTNLTQ